MFTIHFLVFFTPHFLETPLINGYTLGKLQLLQGSIWYPTIIQSPAPRETLRRIGLLDWKGEKGFNFERDFKLGGGFNPFEKY